MRKRFNYRPYLGVLFLVLAVPLTIFMVFQNTDFRQRASTGAVLYLTTDQPATPAGQVLIMEVEVDSKNIPVKDVQINLAYPMNKLDYISSATEDSPFVIINENITGNGVVRLGRATDIPVTGQNHIVTLRFNVKEDIQATEIAPVSGTTILNLENENIYNNIVERSRTSDNKNESFSLSSLFQLVSGIFK